jgi:hypothetical protein
MTNCIHVQVCTLEHEQQMHSTLNDETERTCTSINIRINPSFITKFHATYDHSTIHHKIKHKILKIS